MAQVQSLEATVRDCNSLIEDLLVYIEAQAPGAEALKSELRDHQNRIIHIMELVGRPGVDLTFSLGSIEKLRAVLEDIWGKRHVAANVFH